MPNWTTNTVTIRGDASLLETIRQFLCSEDNLFDFNNILPMPQSLNIEAGGIMTKAMAMAGNEPGSEEYEKAKNDIHLPRHIHDVPEGYPNILQTEEDVIALGKVYLDNMKQYGTPTWYDWRSRMWGTKWNACHTELVTAGKTELVYRFDTAWEEPEPVIRVLAEKYPAASITMEFSYEGYPDTTHSLTFNPKDNTWDNKERKDGEENAQSDL